MRDTQKNIIQYKEQLKHIKEKMFTAFLLFLVACTMVTTTTFAWIVISTSPEVKGITTSVSGNGNLEIALASSNEDGTAKIPEPSQVGDSQKNLLEKNITWGNLINLNDDRYGLSSIVLRPATLNRTNILESPLLAVEYSSDGRILQKSFDFSYANYDNSENKYVIATTNKYGVRAISSVTKEVSGEAAQESLSIYTALKQKLEDSKSLYREIVNDSDSEPEEKRYLAIIADLMGVFLSDKVFNSNTSVDRYMPTIYNMVLDFAEAMRLLGETYVEMANIQIYKNNLTISPYTLTTLLNESESSLKSKSIPVMNGFDTFKKNYTKIIKREDGFYDEETNTILDTSKGGLIQHVEVYKNMTGVKMDQLQGDIDFLVNISSCVIDDTNTIGGMGSMSTGELMGMLRGTHKGTIVKGALKDYEQLSGEKMDAKNMSIKASIATVKANIATDAAAPFTVPTAIDGDGTGNDGDKSILGILFKELDMIETAGDIYGMSLDFWVRTNIENSYLVLEGEPVIQYLPLTNNNGYYVYMDKETESRYYHIPDSNHNAPANPDATLETIPDTTYLEYGTIFSYETNQEITFPSYDENGNVLTDDQGNIIEDSDARKSFISNLKFAQKTIVVGYDGVNRVWEETTALVDGTSTTQGKGSCFIFYPDDPIEQDRMLKLLNAFSVAFIDSNGNVLATASLNSSKAYEEAGKITVPLELNEADSTIIKDTDGNEICTITPLELNADTFISAVIYLDGELIENKDVSDTKNINGYLNLQFGSSEKLKPQEDEKLQQEYIVVTASVDRTEYTAEELPVSTALTINVSGTEASNVRVNFIRKVNNFQGVKLDTLELTRTSAEEKASTWTGNQIFTNPGTYVLRNVWVDGIEYDLEEEISIEVPGLDISAISWDQATSEVYKMSSDYYYDVEVTSIISASEILTPNKVEAMFRNEDNEYVTINMTNTGSSWKGSGRFTSSGTYVLEYLKIDGVFYSVEESIQKIIHLSLGIYAKVELDRTQFDWSPTVPANNVVNLSNVRIYDNKGNALENLSNTTIHYNISGNITNTLSSPLEWHAASKSYRGQFKVITPGVYEFNKISITTADSTSEIKEATAPVLTAISPFTPELVKDSLVMDKYQFAPNNDANFAVEIVNSSSATVVAKVLNVEENEYYYFEAPANKAETVITNEETGESTTVWHFYPMTADNTQDGTWQLVEMYITNVYYDGVFHNKGTGEWWLESDEPNGSYVTYELSDIVNQGKNIQTEILNKIYVTVSNSGHTNTFSGVFSDSLANQYSVSNFQIVYKNKLNTVLTDEILSNYGLSITRNTLEYEFSPKDEVFNDDGDGWWTDSIAPSAVQNELQTVAFTGNEVVYFRYPGTYEPVVNIKLQHTKGDVISDYTFTINKSDTYQNMLKVTLDCLTETVSWSQPDARFTGITFNGQNRSVYKSGGGAFGGSVTYETLQNSYNEEENTVNAYWHGTANRLILSYVNNYSLSNAPQATVTIKNCGEFSSATITLVKSFSSGYSPSSNIFTYSSGQTTATSYIGAFDSVSAGNDKVFSIKDTSVNEIVINTNDGKSYTFKLLKALKVADNK